MAKNINSAADRAASIVQMGRVPEERNINLSRVMAVRVPMRLSAKVYALASKTGKSRNATMVMLLEVALEELVNRLPEDVQEEIYQLEEYALQELIDHSDD